MVTQARRPDVVRKKKATQSKSRVSIVFWMILTGITGGGLGGHFKPDLPIIGPLVQKLLAWKSSSAPDDATDISDLAEMFRAPATSPGGSVSSIQRPPPGYNAPVQLASSRRPPDKLLIASFNIQVFGESKMAKPEILTLLADVVRQFDVVAIQEVRAKSDDILPRFLAAINADGSRYDFIIGPRLGRTVSTEQYAFVFDTTRVEYNPQQVGTPPDPADRLHREPYVARFRARTQSPAQAFTFWLVNTHTDPDEVSEEVDALADVFRMMQTAAPDEDDVILLGDLNASESQLGRLGQIPGIGWAVSGAMTNTRQNKAYDNLIFMRQATSEYTGRWGVFDLQRAYGLTPEQALMVSDHYPVWAEFLIWESLPPNRMTQAQQPLQR